MHTLLQEALDRAPEVRFQTLLISKPIVNMDKYICLGFVPRNEHVHKTFIITLNTANNLI